MESNWRMGVADWGLTNYGLSLIARYSALPNVFVTDLFQPDLSYYEVTLNLDPDLPLVNQILPRPKGANAPHFPYGVDCTPDH